jgi:hypothetical protein
MRRRGDLGVTIAPTAVAIVVDDELRVEFLRVVEKLD